MQHLVNIKGVLAARHVLIVQGLVMLRHRTMHVDSGIVRGAHRVQTMPGQIHLALVRVLLGGQGMLPR